MQPWWNVLVLDLIFWVPSSIKKKTYGRKNNNILCMYIYIYTTHVCMHTQSHTQYLYIYIYKPNISISQHGFILILYTNVTRKHPDSPTPLLCCTLGDIKDFTFNWEDQRGYLENINFPPPLNFTFIEDLQ